MFYERIQQLVTAMNEQHLTHYIISDPSSIDYFTNYHNQPGERFFVLLVSANGAHHLFLNKLFPVPNFKEADLSIHIDLIWYYDGEDILSVLSSYLSDGYTAIDKIWPSHFLLALMNTHSTLKPVLSTLVDDIRAIKSQEEQALMRNASKGNDLAMTHLISLVEQGLKESDMRTILANTYKQLGHDGFSFEPIIAYGANGADPHHETDDSTPVHGDSVVIDIGSMYQGYASDMTRTVFYGEPDDESKIVYELVRQANEAAIAAVKPGISFAEIDEAARSIIRQAGYGEYFTHRLGHFIGRECHEQGDVSQYNYRVAEVGQVFSIEPGIYLPNKVGVRIEDLVIVTENGCEVLNHVPKDLTIIQPLLRDL